MQTTRAQQRWTWINGTTSVNVNGTYGALGVPSGSNSPGTRSGAATWTDAQGNFWIFGGRGNASSSTGLLNDMWRYNPSSNQWTWMSGSNDPNAAGTYGILGLPLFQQPGAREHSAAWVDGNGNFWMFGGSGYAQNDNNPGLLNDLWRFNPTTNTWTWVGGTSRLNEQGEYGNLGNPGANNLPGGRNMATAWLDGNGNLWMFGGYGFSSRNQTGALNDLWRYDISSDRWTWMAGDDREDDRGRYGQKGEFGNNTTPGGRQGATGWTETNGRLWLYGGERSNDDLYADLWVFDPQQNQWAWMSGSDQENEQPSFDTQGEPSRTGHPGSRSNATGWIDPNSDLWLFGGKGYERNNANALNSIWKYSIGSDTWTFVKGSIAPAAEPVFGTRGSAADENTPGGLYGASAWTHQDGSLWLFGGQAGNGYVNQIWHFTPCKSGAISPASGSICQGGFLELTATGGSSYTWLKDNQVINGQSGPTIQASGQGTYSVLVNNGACSVEGLNTSEITLTSAPTGTITPASVTICQGATQTLTATGGTSYEWKRNGTTIPGTSAKINVKDGGTYSVVITNGTCSGPAANTSVITVEPTPAGTITPASAALCNGSAQILTASGGTSYEWSRNGTPMGLTGPTIEVMLPGTYSVIVKGGVCSGPAANTAEVVELNTSGVRYEDVSTSINVPVQLSARIAGQTYEWLPFAGLDDPTSGTPIATLQSEILYTVTITSEAGCTIVDTQLVKIVPGTPGEPVTRQAASVPTAFTPNANNMNDRLRPLGQIARLDYFRVYNRWGILVYQTNVVGEGWDGKYKGVLQQPDTYTWILLGRSTDGQPLKLSGKTVLIR